MRTKHIIHFQLGLAVLLMVLSVALVVFIFRVVNPTLPAANAALDALEHQLDVAIVELEQTKGLGAQLEETLEAYEQLLVNLEQPVESIEDSIGNWRHASKGYANTAERMADICRRYARFLSKELPAGVEVVWGRFEIPRVHTFSYPKDLRIVKTQYFKDEQETLLAFEKDLQETGRSLRRTSKSLEKASGFLRENTGRSLEASKQSLSEARRRLKQLHGNGLPVFVETLKEQKTSLRKSRAALGNVRIALMLFSVFILLLALLAMINALTVRQLFVSAQETA